MAFVFRWKAKGVAVILSYPAIMLSLGFSGVHAVELMCYTLIAS